MRRLRIITYSLQNMIPDPNNNQSPTPNAGPALNEQQIRSMRGDLAQGHASEPSLNVPGKPLFDADEPAFSIPTENQEVAMPGGQTTTAQSDVQSVDQLIATSGGHKNLIWIISAVISVIILGIVGYFIIYPLLTNVAPTVTLDTPTDQVEPIAPSQPTNSGHVSAFINEPSNREVLTLSGVLSHSTIVATLTKKAQNLIPGVSELIMSDDAGVTIPFNIFLSSLLTGFDESQKTSLIFNDDFTAFVFKDSTGSWPGYVATLKPGFVAEDLRSWFSSLEKSPLNNFFIVEPGTFSPFKDGVVNDKYADRYAPSSISGISFSYLVLPQQNKVLISSSFNGLKEALRLMGM